MLVYQRVIETLMILEANLSKNWKEPGKVKWWTLHVCLGFADQRKRDIDFKPWNLGVPHDQTNPYFSNMGSDRPIFFQHGSNKGASALFFWGELLWSIRPPPRPHMRCRPSFLLANRKAGAGTASECDTMCSSSRSAHGYRWMRVKQYPLVNQHGYVKSPSLIDTSTINGNLQ